MTGAEGGHAPLIPLLGASTSLPRPLAGKLKLRVLRALSPLPLLLYFLGTSLALGLPLRHSFVVQLLQPECLSAVHHMLLILLHLDGNLTLQDFGGDALARSLHGVAVCSSHAVVNMLILWVPLAPRFLQLALRELA